MRNIARSSGFKQEGGQLKSIFQAASFVYKGGFSRFILTSASFLSVFPALPPIQPEAIVAASHPESVVTEAQDAETNAEQVCLWQKDVFLFESLAAKDEGTALLQKEVPCTESEKIALKKKAVVSPNAALDASIQSMTAGYPLEVMAPAISEYDREVAALIVGIAKKESDWGKRVPRTPDGADCFNYWGYKGAGTRGIAMGHGCFGSPEEAVHAVGNRIAELVALRQTSEPKNMVIWKCGSSCAAHSPESVKKWISDVDIYYRKIAEK